MRISKVFFASEVVNLSVPVQRIAIAIVCAQGQLCRVQIRLGPLLEGMKADLSFLQPILSCPDALASDAYRVGYTSPSRLELKGPKNIALTFRSATVNQSAIRYARLRSVV